jgi:Fe-S-cluster-containing hydrogenase component 2
MFPSRTRYLLLGLVLFMPPLVLILQSTTGDDSFCGSWCPRMFFLWREGSTLSAFLFGWLRSWAGVLLVLGIICVSIFFGRLWCSHLCPIGGALELGNRIFPSWLSIPYASIPAVPVRYGYFAVYMIAPAIGLGSLACNYCNFAAVPRLFGAAFGSQADIAYFLRSAGLINLALLLLLGVLARGGRAYCNFLCPVGAIDGLANRLFQGFGKRVRINPHRCTGCGQCAFACPTTAISASGEGHQIDQLSCLPCGKCQSVCPEQAISYTRAACPAQSPTRAEVL